ncbi:MAG: universal stress protein [Nocardioides sp.]
MTHQRQWIVLGVDGMPGGEASVDYAVSEALRTGADLRLVHVLPKAPAGTYPVMPTLSPLETQRYGQRILREAARRTGILHETGRVTTRLVNGSRVASLVHAAEDAELLVLGDHRRSLLGRVVTSSVLLGVAARAAIPVVVVPDRWHPRDGVRPVVAAVKDPDVPVSFVRDAATIARARGTSLVVLHAWNLPTAYDDMIVARVDAAVVTRDAREALQGLVARALDGLPSPTDGVDVEIRVVHGQPARVLIEASEDADLLLLARRPHAFPFGHLGAAGRAVLAAAHCPTDVVAWPSDPRAWDLTLEVDGRIEKTVGDVPAR